MPNTKFAAGDLVVCILRYHSLLIEGKTYEVVKADPSWVNVMTESGYIDGFDQGHFRHADVNGRQVVVGIFTIAHFNDTLEAYEHFGVFSTDIAAEREAAKFFPDGKWLAIRIKQMKEVGNG